MKLHHYSWAEFRPRSFEALGHYGKATFMKDLFAGVTVGIVAIPLALAFAIASGVSPQQGLITAIVAGFLVSLLGGSKLQIAGPTGAFIVVLYGVVSAHGYDGLVIATIMAGLMLILLGLLRLGNTIRYIPSPVIVGFTAGIAVIIFSGQVKDFFGLAIAKPPAEILPKWISYFDAAGTFNSATTLLGLFALAIIIFFRNVKLIPIPPAIIAVIAAALLAFSMHLPVETIGSKFGGIPQQLPAFQWPEITWARIVEMFPSALAITMLGGIESLLSALVADSMSGDKHKSNIELVAQGIANIASALFGGIAATGAIARTGVNVKSGGQTPFAGMIHAVFLLLVMLALAPLASAIPLVALAAVLFVVSFDMSERKHFWHYLKGNRKDAAVLLVTFLLTVFSDLTKAVIVGTALSFALVHGHHMLRPKETLRLLVEGRNSGGN